MFSWIASKGSVIALAGAACLSLFIVTRDPAKAGPAGDGDGRRPADTFLAQADTPAAAEPSVVTGETVVPAAADPEPAEAADARDWEIARLKETIAALQTEVAQKTEQIAQGRAEEDEAARRQREEEEERASRVARQDEMQQRYRDAKVGRLLDEELDRGTALEFPQTPLRDALHFLADAHDFNMMLDERALTDAGVNVDENIDVVLTGVSLRSALNVILDPYDLTYTQKNDVLLVTTKERAQSESDTRVYDISGLMLSEEDAEKVVDELSRLLPTEPDPKLEAAGVRPVAAEIVMQGERFLATSTWDGHRRIEDVLRAMKPGR